MTTETNPFFLTLHESQTNCWIRATDSTETTNWIDRLFKILFPEKALAVDEIALLWEQSKTDFKNLISKLHKGKSANSIAVTTENIFAAFPKLYFELQKDAQAMLDRDPAAECIQEIINSYPGFMAIAVYRIANAISLHKVVMLPRILTEYAHSKTGIDIHPNATIDVPFVIDHGTGIVIGETAVIGKNVHIYQGVTLGALQVEKNMKEKKRHPTVEDDVIIYANATILGGSTVIGNHSIIGGNAFITKSVDPNSVVMQSTKNNILTQGSDINLFSI